MNPYNHAQQPSQVKLTLGSTALQQYDYDYGAFNTSTGAVDTTKNNGQIGKITGSIGGTAQWNQGFSYDELGRLSNIVEHQGSSMSTQTFSQGFGYDRYGNKTQSANSALGLPAVASTDYDTTNHNNRFVSSVATYDNAGNIATDSKFRSLTYAYDANNRQTSASNGTWTESQTYDCAGQRVQTSVSGVGSATYRTMVYDIFGQDVADYTGSTGGTLERENIYRGGLLATYEAGTSSLRYVLQDAQASTRAIMNNSGSSSSVIARHDYLPFGEEISAGIGLRTSSQGYGVTDTNRQKYGLTERDDTTGLDHTWFRKYENLSGRWTSPDPYDGSYDSTDPQSFNRYSYTQNDPVNFIDPSGLFLSPSTPGGYVRDPATGIWVWVSGPDASVDLYLGGEFGIGLGGGGGSEMGLLQFKSNMVPVLENATPEQQGRFGDAWEELWRRIHANGGNNDCAKLFGGVKNAEKVLKGIKKFSVGETSRPKALAEISGKNVTIDPSKGFFDTSGNLTIQVGLNPAAASFIQLGNVELAAFVLIHELAHRAGKIPDDDETLGVGSVYNNGIIHNACFKDVPAHSQASP